MSPPRVTVGCALTCQDGETRHHQCSQMCLVHGACARPPGQPNGNFGASTRSSGYWDAGKLSRQRTVVLLLPIELLRSVLGHTDLGAREWRRNSSGLANIEHV
jgi:hypothetical protein